MDILQAIILGLVQGLTEFIPVSSSGHLVVAHRLLGVAETGLAFDVALHLGTLIAMIVYFRRDLWRYIRALVKKDEESRLSWFLVMATVPAAVIGFLLQDRAESSFRSPALVGLTMFVFGLVMLIAEYAYRKQQKHTTLENVTRTQALAMGFAQALAIIPGVSRSGSTITAGLFAGLDRVSATRFSFLLGIPITAGAVLKIITSDGVLRQFQTEQGAVVAGIIAALFSGLFAIKFMLKFLSRHGLQVFAYYRVIVGAILLLVFTLG